MTLKYEIRFLDYWHMSSGLSGGAKHDSYVVKDSLTSMPYIPGKTIKGLVREMAELFEKDDFIKKCFGDKEIDMGECFFSNVTLKKETEDEIIKNNLQNYLYDEIASTKIGRDKNEKETEGIAVDNSLREIEAVIPLTLQGTIENIPKDYEEMMEKSLKMIKRMGLNRNRGLGRCEIKVEEL
jgi:CRISPR/Cas system CSM-associated protein Csm3 (group 7 of RAMP superfamily)